MGYMWAHLDWMALLVNDPLPKERTGPLHSLPGPEIPTPTPTRIGPDERRDAQRIIKRATAICGRKKHHRERR